MINVQVHINVGWYLEFITKINSKSNVYVDKMKQHYTVLHNHHQYIVLLHCSNYIDLCVVVMPAVMSVVKDTSTSTGFILKCNLAISTNWRT